MADKGNGDYERLDKYRQDLEGDISENKKEYNTIITYLAAGAMGLFLTINEKFFHLIESRHFWLFVLSLIFLSLTLLLYLLNVVYDNDSLGKLRDKTSEKISAGKYDGKDLDAYWGNLERFSNLIMYARMVTVVLGIAFEVIFIVVNMRVGSETGKKVNEITIQYPVEAGRPKIIVDTTGKDYQIEIK